MSRVLLLVGLTAAAVTLLARPAAAAGPAPALLTLRLATASAGEHVVSTGATVRIIVSDALPPGNVDVAYWADFVGALPHGDELERVTIYLVPNREVRLLCGVAALACYDSRRELIVTPVESAPEGLTLEAILAHEYGHHVARNRLNPPWSALDFGTKRWATYVGVCPGVRTGRFTLQGSGDRYPFNPGEVFAESYRLLAERRLGREPVRWLVVDPGFEPDDTALARLEQDVLVPWARNTVARHRASVPRSFRLATPLDGRMTITLASPRTGVYELRLPGVGRARVPGAGRATIQAEVCGTRVFNATVVRVRGRGAYTLTVSRP